MKKHLALFFCLFIVFNLSYGQIETTPFVIREIQMPDTAICKKPTEFKKENLNFFEDEKYVVRKTCSGEWGGSVWFKNKQTNKEYACSASCPVIIYKLNGKYIVTNSMDHMYGSSSVIEIANPKTLKTFKLPKPRSYINGKPLRYTGDNESQSTKGTKNLLDTAGVLILASFPHQGLLYYVVGDQNKAFIAKIENKKLVSIEALSNDVMWPDDIDVIKTIDKRLIVFFHNRNTKGYLEIFENKIDIVKYHL